jgi:signal transduction histidine kinase
VRARFVGSTFLRSGEITLSLNRSVLARYSLPILFVAVADVSTIAVEPLFQGKAPLFFFTVATLISAGYGGVGPGLLATGLSVVIVSFFFQPEVLVLAVAHSSLALFAVLGVGVSLIIGHLHRVNAALARSNGHLGVAKETLSERTQALSQANEELQRFAYALAHDLSAPLRGISALTALLIERNVEKLDESSKECAEMIVEKVDRAQSMIKGLLDYAAAVEKPEGRALVDCNAVLERAKQDLDTAIEHSGACITVDSLPSVPATESHLVQVFTNLISNAIKYRPSVREPRIRVSASERIDDWVFCVSDNGIGLDMRYADQIFGMFRRLHAEGQYEGTGIGLALCKIVVQRHGGRIWVESEIGKGSRFFFTLPKRVVLESVNPRLPEVRDESATRTTSITPR